MQGLNYKRLDKITNSVPPFRGNANRFPLVKRRENTKYFLVRDESGQRVFDIVYGNKFHGTDLTKEEYETLEAQGCNEVHKYPRYNDGVKLEDSYDYKRYVKIPNILGTVRPDNTFEFTQRHYYQGTRQVLSRMSMGYFATDSRRGGLVYSDPRNGVFHPIYAGMRIDTETMKPSIPYEIFIHHVDRKKSKAVLGKYEHFFKVSEVMLKNMTMDMVVSTAKEILEELRGSNEKEYRTNNYYFVEAEKRINDAPLDAFILYCMGLDVGRIAYQARWSNGSDTTNAHEYLFVQLKRKLSKEVYKRHPDIFDEVKCESGRRYPSCDWGVKIIVNGKEMEQLV